MSVIQVRESASNDVSHRQVELKLWHPGCWTLEVTEALAETHVFEKSLYISDDQIKGDFILVSDGDTPISQFVEAVDGHEVVEDVAILKRGEDRARAVVSYERDSSIVPEIVNSEFMPIEPVHITGGYEYWTVLVQADQLEPVFNEMEDEHAVELQTIREVNPTDKVEFADDIDRISDRLSSRQLECLFEANDAGYYEWPRDVSAKDVAARLDISGPTFLEHVRKGEQKVLKMILAKLRTRNARLRDA